MPKIPVDPLSVTPAWLSEVLEADVRQCELQQIGIGVGSYRADGGNEGAADDAAMDVVGSATDVALVPAAGATHPQRRETPARTLMTSPGGPRCVLDVSSWLPRSRP